MFNDEEVCGDALCYFDWSVAEYDIEERVEEDRAKLVTEGWKGGYPDAD